MNESHDWAFVSAGKLILATLVSYWMVFHQSIQILLCLMLLDILTGIIAGVQQRELSSQLSRKGMSAKAGTLIIILSLYILSGVVEVKEKLPVELGNIVTWFYVFTEFVSVVENSAKLGAPVPPVLLEVIQRAKKLQMRQDAAVEKAVDSQQVAVAAAKQAQKDTDKLIKTLPKDGAGD